MFEMTNLNKTTYAVSKTGTQLVVVTPYNPSFIAAAKAQLGGRWNGAAWIFDIRDQTEVMAMLKKYYDWKPGMALVSVKVYVEAEQRYSRSPFVMLGRALVSAWGRDGGARLGLGVRLHAGAVTSGGSVKYWETVIRAGTELVVHDVPEGMARSYVDGTRSKEQIRVELFRTIPVLDVVALTSESEGLILRIAEIKIILEAALEQNSAEV